MHFKIKGVITMIIMKTINAYFVSKYLMSTSCLLVNGTCVSTMEKNIKSSYFIDYNTPKQEAF